LFSFTGEYITPMMEKTKLTRKEKAEQDEVV
jgi:hypothetical protein